MRVIRDEATYAAAMARLDELVMLDPDPSSPEGEELQVLSILIEDYEKRAHSVAAPTPIQAIEFRMDQMGLSQRDLVPFIGSRSKTSEVLSGKRPLSLPMIRALSAGLGIPAAVLIQGGTSDIEEGVDWSRLPLKELERRSWFSGSSASEVGTLISSVLGDFGGDSLALAARASAQVRSGRELDAYSLMAWAAWVITQARSDPPATAFEGGAIDDALVSRLVRLSSADDGPVQARALLRSQGVAVVVAEHLPKTYLDGALIFGKFPIIALTLRHDRIDSFWFTLMHEVAHLRQLVGSGELRSFFDDLDVDSQDELERDADSKASQALIPDAAWFASPASKLRSPEAAQHLATQLGIHPAIVAGRIRHAAGDYRRLSRMVGQGQVRRLFQA